MPKGAIRKGKGGISLRVDTGVPDAGGGSEEGDQRGGARVVLAEHHTLFAQMITYMLEANEFEVAGVAASTAEAIERMSELDPDLVLVDIDLPGAGQIKAAHPSVTMIAIGSSDDEERMMSAFHAGFEGFISKDAASADFIAYIHNVVYGGPSRLKRLRPGRSRPLDEAGEALFRASYLTPREREVLFLLTEGANSRLLATQLSLSPHTVRSHIQNILAKLQVHSRLEAAAFATRFGIVDSNARANDRIPSRAQVAPA
ncbi:MAG: response regulator transcription factor [Actinomycetota bacterium]